MRVECIILRRQGYIIVFAMIMVYCYVSLHLLVLACLLLEGPLNFSNYCEHLISAAALQLISHFPVSVIVLPQTGDSTAVVQQFAV